MAGHPTRPREAVRRVAAGLVLLLAAGVVLKDDLHGIPDARRGARQVQLDLPHLGTTEVSIPQATPTGVVLLLHRGGGRRDLQRFTDAVPWHAMLVDVDVTRLAAAPGPCAEVAAALEDISRRAQRDAGLTRYRRPVLLSAPSALSITAAAIAGSTALALPAAVALGLPAGGPPAVSCAPPRASQGDPHIGRWYTPPQASAIAPLVEQALTSAAEAPLVAPTPIQRWLRHFDLPLTAAWSSTPRAMLVLLSPARGWRSPEEAMAQRLASSGVHVIGIDALHSFWQRRSPRDVALELQRLTEALATAGLPVYIGGREFGAETMAVAGEMMPSTRHVAGMVLIDPGPTAFFEVEPPTLALRPTGPSDWSTRTAVRRLERPTLCVTHTPHSSSALLCASLGGSQTRLATTGRDTSALADTIARFVLR